MENAVVYARYSSHSQTDQSIEGQLSAARKYAKEHNYNIIHYYCDRAKTGTNDNREQFQSMLKDSEQGNFTVVIVWKVDRFGRNREEIAFNKHRLKKNKARVEYVAENVSDGPEGVILESVLEGMAEYYSLQLSQNIRRGRLESAKKHKAINSTMPLGYVRDENKDYQIEPKEAIIVKEIFEQLALGNSLAEVTRYVNSKGYKTKRGKEFTKSSLPRIVDNENYIGVYKYKDTIRDEDAIPAIISRELWNTVHQKLPQHRRKSSDKWEYNTYLLTGKIFCGECRASMMGISGTSSTSSKYNYYVCSAKHGRKTCELKNIRQDILENLVISQISDILLQKEKLQCLTNEIWEYYQANLPERNSEVNTYRSELSRIDKQIDNIIKAVEDGMEYSIVKNRLEDLYKHHNECTSLLQEKAITKTIELTKEQISAFLTGFLSGNIIDLNCRQKILETLVNSVCVYQDHIEIAVNYGQPNGEMYFKSIVRNRSLKWSCAHDIRTAINGGYWIIYIPR